MIPAGYMAKRVAARPEWLLAERVSSIYSVSDCISSDFANYVTLWKHNGYWLFDSPEVIIEIARDNRMDLAGTTLFFYEVHDLQFDDGKWTRFEPEPSAGSNVRVPEVKVLEGFDVVTFFVQAKAECSPLSCNGLASQVETNSRCLLQSFDQARTLLENGTFDNSEPGPRRVFAVYTVGWPAAV